jgi:hypothetical protein
VDGGGRHSGEEAGFYERRIRESGVLVAFRMVRGGGVHMILESREQIDPRAKGPAGRLNKPTALLTDELMMVHVTSQLPLHNDRATTEQARCGV